MRDHLTGGRSGQTRHGPVVSRLPFGVAIKAVWAYAILVLLGGFAMVMYARWQNTDGLIPFLSGLVARAAPSPSECDAV